MYTCFGPKTGENVEVCCKSACLSCKRLKPGKEIITKTSVFQVKIYEIQTHGRLLLLELVQLMFIAACQIQIGLLHKYMVLCLWCENHLLFML
jgi:hypothetical protein